MRAECPAGGRVAGRASAKAGGPCGTARPRPAPGGACAPERPRPTWLDSWPRGDPGRAWSVAACTRQRWSAPGWHGTRADKAWRRRPDTGRCSRDPRHKSGLVRISELDAGTGRAQPDRTYRTGGSGQDGPGGWLTPTSGFRRRARCACCLNHGRGRRAPGTDGTRYAVSVPGPIGTVCPIDVEPRQRSGSRHRLGRAALVCSPPRHPTAVRGGAGRTVRLEPGGSEPRATGAAAPRAQGR